MSVPGRLIRLSLLMAVYAVAAVPESSATTVFSQSVDTSRFGLDSNTTAYSQRPADNFELTDELERCSPVIEARIAAPDDD